MLKYVTKHLKHWTHLKDIQVRKLGIRKWFKKHGIELIVSTISATLLVGLAIVIIGPHVTSIWPISTPIVINAPNSDDSMPQATPSIGGVLSSTMTIGNYATGYEVDGSATIFNNQNVMTMYNIQPIIPTSGTAGGLVDGYVAAPSGIINWVTFNTGNTVFIDPNSKVTVKIVFKIPSSYKTALPKNWQFDISFESNANPINTTAQNGQTINIQTQYLFRWLISMK